MRLVRGSLVPFLVKVGEVELPIINNPLTAVSLKATRTPGRQSPAPYMSSFLRAKGVTAESILKRAPTLNNGRDREMAKSRSTSRSEVSYP